MLNHQPSPRAGLKPAPAARDTRKNQVAGEASGGGVLPRRGWAHPVVSRDSGPHRPAPQDGGWLGLSCSGWVYFEVLEHTVR